jgi:hypothetical protein
VNLVLDNCLLPLRHPPLEQSLGLQLEAASASAANLFSSS